MYEGSTRYKDLRDLLEMKIKDKEGELLSIK